ncbi:unnamed protein product [Cylindrotheca closterium]|uniref:Uncharacterized protein n=1 Tax=Cylindrotheca closterium TaxID=2856 RepID=A0AAD2FF01_9STRA|nr:unnamed protein product [Cylindrotheca closterium]
MVTLNPFKKKGQKGTASPEKAENDEFTEDIKGMPSNSTVNTEESSPQSPVPGSAASTSGKSKSKRRNSSGTIKKSSREGRSADDSSVKRSKSKTRSKKSDDGAAEDSGNSPTRKKKKKKDKEKSSADSGYSSDSGLKSIKNKKKKSKKDKKNKSTSSKDGDESRDNSLKGSGSDPETESSPKRSPTTAAKVPKVAAAGIVASFEVASPKPMEPTPAKSAAPTPRQVTPPPVGTSKSGRDEEQVKKSTTSSPKRPSSSTQPTKANSTGSSPKLDRQGSSSVQDRASIFKKENGAAPIAPGQHLEGATATAERKSVVTTGGPRRMPKGGSQQLAGVDDQENATEQQVNKPRSSSVGKYAPTTRRSEKKTTDTAKEDGSSGVKNAMNVFEGGKVRRSVAPKQKSLDVGKLRTAYLKQEDNTKKAEASASLTAPSLGKDTNNGPAMKRSTSGGNVRNAYLKKLSSSGGDDSAATEESFSASKPGVGRPSQNTPWSLAKSLGLSSSATGSANNNNNKNNSLPSSSTAAAAAAVANDKPPGPGSIKSAYLNATQNSTSPPRPDRARANSSDDGAPGKVKLNAFAMFDPSLKKEQDAESKEPELTASEKRANTVKNLIATQGKSQEERQGRDKQINTGGKRRSSSAGTVGRIKNNPARALLEAQFGGGKASQTTGTIGQRADAFSAKHGSSSKTMDEVSTPKAVRRVMNLNALNLATPGRSTKKPTGPKRKDMKKLLSQGDADASFADTVAPLLRDRKQKPLVRELCDRIQKADGVPQTRRLSMRDNDLIVSMIGAIQNDPDVKSIIVDGDVAFNTVGTTLLFGFVEALGMNMHLRRLTFKNVQLGNDILYALATAMERNFILEEIDLSWNLFTSEGLSNFCQSLASSNETCKKIMLNNQTTPISEASEEDVLEAFGENKRIMYAKVDFSSDDGQDKLNKILYRNKRNPPGPVDRDKKIIEILSFQAERAEAIKEQKDAENKPLEVPEDDWDYLYELAVLFDKYKLKDIVESENNDKDKKAKPKNADSMGKGAKSNFLFGQFKDILDDSLGCFNSDGSFLTAEFISKYLKKTQDTEELVFDFHGQWKLFKRFPVTDPARELIVTKFVDAIVSHPQMKEFMGINMANTGCGDDFLEKLAERCLADHSLLPNMHVINFETNFINERGCVALSKIIASPTCMKYLQLVRLENQKGLLTSKAEFNICRAMFVNRSVVVVSLQFRGLMERQQIHAYVSRNVDFLRQARQRHYKKTGTGRKRNETELFFDKIASNNGLVKEVKLPGDRKFLSLSAEERVKAAQAFAENTHITNVNLNGCELDDAFAEAMGKSLETNMAIEKLSLESNSISGTGIKYLLEGLAKNTTLKELRLHKQSKNVATAEEDGLADTLEANESLTKLGLDFRNQAVQVQVDRKLKMNDQLKRSKDSSDNLNYLFT